MTTSYIPYCVALDRDLAFPAAPLGFRFAAALNVVPLLAWELPLAAAHYPVVFLPGATEPVLAALVGIGDGRNCYVDAEGRWLDGAYIPAWIRRCSCVSERRTSDGGIETAVTVTRAFTAAVHDAGLLQDSNMRIERPGVEPHQIAGFAAVRADGLAALPDATVRDFHRKGYLDLLHAHLISLGSTRQLAAAKTGAQVVH